jgi:hypothetical protein
MSIENLRPEPLTATCLHALNPKEICMARKTANGKTRNPPKSRSPKETSARTVPEGVEEKVLALAEQMGRLIGTVQGKAEGWLDPRYMRDQLTRIQEGAGDLLSHLGSAADKSGESTRQPAVRASRGRSGGKVDAPGKKHRPPPPSTRQAKPSDDRVAKLRAANRSIRRPRQR